MESLTLSVRTSFPIFFLLMVGILLRKSGKIGKTVFDGCTTLVYECALPLNLFVSIVSIPISESFDVKLICTGVAATVAFWLINLWIMPALDRSDPRRGAMVQGSFRSNHLLLGIPIARILAGERAAAMTALLVSFLIVTFNILAIITLERFRGGRNDHRGMLRSIVSSPLIISAALGIVWSCLGISLPDVLLSTMKQAGDVATPLSLIALGGTFQAGELRKNAKPLGITVLSKLVLMPVFFLLIGLFLRMDAAELAALTGVSITPTAVSTYAMAQKMGSDGELAGQIVVVTSLLSVVSMFAWVFLLSSAGIV